MAHGYRREMDSREQVLEYRREPARVACRDVRRHRHSSSSTSSLLRPLVLVAILAAQVPEPLHVSPEEACAPWPQAWAHTVHDKKPEEP